MVEMLGKDRARRIARLATAKGRREAGRLLLDAPSLVREGIERGLAEELFVANDGLHAEIVAVATAAGVTITPVDDDTLQRVVDVEQSPGLFAVARPPELPDWEAILARPRWRILLADGLGDPGNVGTIARTAAAFGFDALLLAPGSADPMAPKTLRASAGALLVLPTERVAPVSVLEGVEAVAVRAATHGGRSIHEIKPPDRLVLWLGHETRGTDSAVPLEVQDVTIPLPGTSESLNVAAAAAIFCAWCTAP